jgi:hypothetical protein
LKPDNAICSNCAFYVSSSSGKHGYCRFNPPVFTNIDPETGFARFWNVVVNPNGWCAQFSDTWD